MFLEPLSKGSGGFPYIFLITLHPVTFVHIDDSTLFHKRIFVLGSHQEAFDGISSFKVYLHSIFLASSFEAFTQPFIIWHHYVVLFLVASHAGLVFFVGFFGGADVLIFIFTLLIAQSGYLHHLHLPAGHNICQPPHCSGNSISHLAITSARYHPVVTIPSATWH